MHPWFTWSGHVVGTARPCARKMPVCKRDARAAPLCTRIVVSAHSSVSATSDPLNCGENFVKAASLWAVLVEPWGSSPETLSGTSAACDLEETTTSSTSKRGSQTRGASGYCTHNRCGMGKRPPAAKPFGARPDAAQHTLTCSARCVPRLGSTAVRGALHFTAVNSRSGPKSGRRAFCQT